MKIISPHSSIRNLTRTALSSIAVAALLSPAALFGQQQREKYQPGSATGQEYSNVTPVAPTIHATPTPPTLDAQQTKIGPGVTPIEEMRTREAIRDNWANYTLLIDGDGLALRQQEWANLTFTKDFKWVFYDSAGRTTGEVGLDAMQRLPVPGAVQRPWKHLPISTKFDEINRTTAKTRTVMVMLGVPKATVPNRRDGAEGLSTPGVPAAAMAVYHDTWRKENGYWLKSSTIVYSANCGMFPGPELGNFTCVDNASMYTSHLDMSKNKK